MEKTTNAGHYKPQICLEDKAKLFNVIVLKIKQHAILMQDALGYQEKALHDGHASQAEYWRGNYNAHRVAINLLEDIKLDIKRL